MARRIWSVKAKLQEALLRRVREHFQSRQGIMEGIEGAKAGGWIRKVPGQQWGRMLG